jgi:hypothetical protein
VLKKEIDAIEQEALARLGRISVASLVDAGNKKGRKEKPR